ncbi:MAG: site-2 protease family protein [Polyangiaceae bacterium]|nr:site-2 protease family protein [Polyangiaceae bacterium]
MTYLVAILGLAVLMIVHEAGHYFAARAFGLRVIKFSIGFGPTFFKIQPVEGFWTFVSLGDRVKVKLFKHDPERHGPTIFQVAMIPFLAFVQIDGMNPLETPDPRDKGLYANASIWGRIVTIFAGPAANYVFASVFFFFPFWIEGRDKVGEPTQIVTQDGAPAAVAGLKNADTILSIDGTDVKSFEDISAKVQGAAEKPVAFVVLRDGEKVTIPIQAESAACGPSNTDSKKVCIGVRPYTYKVPVSAAEAAKHAVVTPPVVVKSMLGGLAEWARGKSKEELGGPTRMVHEMKKVADEGWAEFIFLLGALSAYLAAFNLLPIPALDGGRLMFLGYEAATRKRANPTVEAHIHVIGLVMMLGLMLYVTFANDVPRFWK